MSAGSKVIHKSSNEIASVTICLEEPQVTAGSNSAKGANRLDTITEGESIVKQRMRQFNANISYERHALHSTGESNETSPSWTSPPSSAMETPNETDHQLAFDFSKRCDVDPDLTNQIDQPKTRMSLSPTTPETPRQTSSGSFFRFPFVGNSSPRRARALSVESHPSDGAASSGVSGGPAPPSEQNATGMKLRFPRFLRRTHSASYSSSEEPPAYALFLRSKPTVSKTRSAEMAGSTIEPEDSSTSAASCRARLSEMRLRLGFLRRRSTESSISARPSPEEAQKWTESFADLMASKYGAALYRAFLLREFSNENLEFWVAVEEYKLLKPQKMATKAQKVYNDFIAVQAPKEVNLDSETRMITLTNVQSNKSDPHAFDRAQRRIQNMMERDSYQRFLRSELVMELIHPERYSGGSDAPAA